MRHVMISWKIIHTKLWWIHWKLHLKPTIQCLSGWYWKCHGRRPKLKTYVWELMIVEKNSWGESKLIWGPISIWWGTIAQHAAIIARAVWQYALWQYQTIPKDNDSICHSMCMDNSSAWYNNNCQGSMRICNMAIQNHTKRQWINMPSYVYEQ